MHNFKYFAENFLTEKKKVSQAKSSNTAADDKGKLHELLLSKHLSPTKELPTHFAAKNKSSGRQSSPTDVHNKLAAKVGPEAYAEIDSHAANTAAAVIKHMRKHGLMGRDHKIGTVHWTSIADKPNTPGDHQRLTKENDPNSNADVIVGIHTAGGQHVRYVGISAKYGSGEPNYKNPGAATMESTAGIKPGTLMSHIRPHHKRMEAAGYSGVSSERHGQWKADRLLSTGMLGKKVLSTSGIKAVNMVHQELSKKIASGAKVKPEERYFHAGLSEVISSHRDAPDKKEFVQSRTTRYKDAESSALESKRAVMGAFIGDKKRKSTGGLIHKSDNELRDIITDNVSPKTKIPHIVAWTKVQSDGSSVPVVKNSEDIAKDHLAQFEKGSLRVKEHRGGVSTDIIGLHKATGTERKVASMAIKSTSGPHKFGPAGTFQLPQYKDK